MKIYTKTGDEGDTGLYGGERVPKSHRRIEAYGTIDDLNSVIGIVISELAGGELVPVLQAIQNNLFSIGSDLSAPYSVKNMNVKRIELALAGELEKVIDRYEEKLEEIRNFILPGGSKTASFLHLARTVCRRAERKVVELSSTTEINKNIIVYLNRLSDLFFVLARFENKAADIPDVIWKNQI